jgi:hypothetical protein
MYIPSDIRLTPWKNAEKLVSRLRDIVRAEVEKDTNLLKKDRSKSSILVGGAVDRFISPYHGVLILAGPKSLRISSESETVSLGSNKYTIKSKRWSQRSY